MEFLAPHAKHKKKVDWSFSLGFLHVDCYSLNCWQVASTRTFCLDFLAMGVACHASKGLISSETLWLSLSSKVPSNHLAPRVRSTHRAYCMRGLYWLGRLKLSLRIFVYSKLLASDEVETSNKHKTTHHTHTVRIT